MAIFWPYYGHIRAMYDHILALVMAMLWLDHGHILAMLLPQRGYIAAIL